MKVDFTYPSWMKWKRIMGLTEVQVKAFLPEFNGKNFLNKGVKVLETDTYVFHEWKEEMKKPRSLFSDPPLPGGLVAIENCDGRFYLTCSLP